MNIEYLLNEFNEQMKSLDPNILIKKSQKKSFKKVYKLYMIEESVYKLTEKQFEKVTEWQEKCKLNFHLENDFGDFLEQNKSKYKYLGELDGNFRC